VQQDIHNMQMYAQKELSNIAAYRSKLQQKDDIIRQRQGQYKDQVMSASVNREYQMSQLI